MCEVWLASLFPKLSRTGTEARPHDRGMPDPSKEQIFLPPGLRKFGKHKASPTGHRTSEMPHSEEDRPQHLQHHLGYGEPQRYPQEHT